MSKIEIIRSLGLENYLDQTAGEHNGKDYSAFIQYIDLGLSNKKIGKQFGVHRNTVAYWKSLLTVS